jgi:peptide/nickel transport system substrate-binding protein
MRNRLVRCAAVLGAATLLTTLPTSISATAAAKKLPTLTLGTIAGIKTFAAIDAELGNRAIHYQAVYDSLLKIEPDGSVKPWLATSFTYDAARTLLTLKLKTGIKFTDGKPFNADAAAKNLTRLKGSKGIGAPLIAAMTSAKAKDATTLEIALSGPDPAFVNYLGGTAGMMESPAAFNKPIEITAPVGTGPYTVDSGKTVADSVYTFKANPGYWNKGAVKYGSVVLKVIADPAAMINAIKAGEINGGNLINNDALDEVKGAGYSLLSHELDWAGLTLVDRDGKLGTPLKDVKVRQAMNFAFDRAAIMKAIAAGHGTVTTQVFRKNSPAFDPALDSMYKYDPTKAKALLTEAGLKDGFELKMAKVAILGEAVYVLLADQLGAIGIKVTWVDTELGNYFGDILTPKYAAFLMFLEQNGNDWQAMNFLTSKTAIWNPSHYSDAVSEDLYAKIQVANDKDRPALLKAYGKHITEDAWFVPMYRIEGNFALDSKTSAVGQNGNAVPFLFNFSPKK